LDEGVGSNDASNVSEAHLPCGANCAAMVAAQIHVEPADDYRHGGVGAHGDEEETRVFNVLVVVHRKHDCEARDSYRNGDDSKGESMLREVRASGYDHCECKGTGPRWDRVKLCLDWRVAVRLHDCWREESVSICWHDHTEIHQTTKNNLIIFEDTADVPDCDLAFCSRTTLVDL